MTKPKAKEPTTKPSLKAAIAKVKYAPKPAVPYAYDIKVPTLLAGVVPADRKAPVLAMDYSALGFMDAALGGGFPGFPYLSQLATRAEYRAFASTHSTELTREGIKFTSKQDNSTTATEKIKQIEAEFERIDVIGVIQKAAEHDCYFGRGQIFIDLQGHDPKKPLILDKRTIKMGSLNGIKAIEAIWTSPSNYNASDPAAPDFYVPSSWFMLGQQVHASRLMTIITRQLPDILKPAFNFAGMSLSQLAEPYVDNWLRTRQSVADLIDNFSTTVLKTDMSAILTAGDNGASVMDRADLFTATRSNKGLMILDMTTEDLGQVNTPLSGLHELQAQSQEQMCSVSRTPAIILTGISPGGLNASSDSEIKVFYDWIAAQQKAFWRNPIDTILKVVQLSLFGEIDADIGFDFVPLYQMDPKELAEIRKSDADAGTAYINAGVIDPQEERQRLASDATSGYPSLDMGKIIEPPTPPGFGEVDPLNDDEPDSDNPFAKPAQDSEFKEGDHPRADNGQFGSGGGSDKLAKAVKDNPKLGRWGIKPESVDSDGNYTLYHGTNEKNVDAIREHGLEASDSPKFFTLTTDKEVARKFAEGYGGNKVIEFKIPLADLINTIHAGYETSSKDTQHAIRNGSLSSKYIKDVS